MGKHNQGGPAGIEGYLGRGGPMRRRLAHRADGGLIIQQDSETRSDEAQPEQTSSHSHGQNSFHHYE